MALHHACSHIRKSADISAICASPQLIAACHVLLRLLMPRHSPYALLRLNFLDLSILLGSRLSELLEFLQIFGIIFRVKGFPFTLLFSSSTSVKSFTLFGKTYLRILLPFTLASKICPLICSFLLFLSLYSVFNEHILIAHSPTPFAAQRRFGRTDRLQSVDFEETLSVSEKSLVGLDGLEPSTSRLSGARSNHLSYRPFSPMVIRFESIDEDILPLRQSN